MKARIKPLSGKYYGTKVKVFDQHGSFTIELWDNDDFLPSVRECEDSGITQQQWIDNEIIDGFHAKEILEICDSHFESDLTYNRALKLVKLINGVEE